MGLGREAGESKYFPPTYDPKATGKAKGPKGPQTVKIMLPMGLQCEQCGEWIGQNKKFLAQKEKVIGEEYLGLAIFRLVFRCASCSNAISIKTDPKNHDYTVEFGAARKYQHHIAEKEKAEAEDAAREKDKGDQLAETNQKVLDTQRQASEMEQLEDMQYKVASRSHLTIEDLFEATAAKHSVTEEEAEAADADEAARVFAAKSAEPVQGAGKKRNFESVADGADGDEGDPHGGLDFDIQTKPKKKAKKKKKVAEDAGEGLGSLLGY
eukprot:TRINITY_DN32785_c0_g1_i1.p1 TRINITY_DN32785_c0_g1~~TRINITY_DN32785_c0_g1_i1.p1  ORF type:complete len:267 (+),score=120.11 TRINITY_DN32785_c0_g1_i1:92-892(+)